MRGRMIILLGLGVIGMLSSTGRSGVHQLWVNVYTPGSGWDGPAAMAVDPQGNIIETGFGREDYLTFKYTPTGQQLWMARYYGPNNSADTPYDLAVDSAGNVYVTGISDDSGSPTAEDYVTIKYNSSGVEQWVARYNGPGNEDDEAFAIAVDGAGSVYVTGQSWLSSQAFNYATIKYDSLGVEQWVAYYDGPGHSYDRAEDIAVDREGNIWVTGSSRRESSVHTEDVYTLKYSPSGALLWDERFCPAGYDYGKAVEMTMDSSGNVLIAGYAYNSVNYDDYLTLKYNLAGVRQWESLYNFQRADYARGIACDSRGNVFVTGDAQWLGAQNRWTTVKYDSTGVQLWVYHWAEQTQCGDYGYDITVDDSGNAYTTGLSFFWDFFGHEGMTLKITPDGALDWVARFSGMSYPGTSSEFNQIIVLDDENNVYVAGKSQDDTGQEDWYAIKYTQHEPDVSIDLIPATTPIQIPPAGGTFEYQIEVNNNDSLVRVGVLWIMVIAPNGLTIGPIAGPIMVDLPLGTSIWHKIQTVPGGAPAGMYTYIGYVGVYRPCWIWDSDSIEFEKLPGGDGIIFGDKELEADNWFCTSDFYDSAGTISELPIIPMHFMIAVCPNPFNPRTAISYQLSRDGHVKLQVFDISGRLVATLVDGWREAGTHEVTFDGSGLASGVYVYWLEAAEHSALGKMVLMK